MISRLHGEHRIQTLCQQIRETAAMLLEEFEHPLLGLGYRAKEDIGEGVILAFYTGRLEKFSSATSRHVINLGKSELRYDLTADGTPPAGESMPLGSMQLVNHSCSPNCASDPVDSESSLELTVLKSIRPILKGELISYKYGGSFWRSRSALAACKRQQGCKLVVCQCATPCPNDYARFERVNPSRSGQVNEKPKDQDGRERLAPAKRRRKQELVTGSQSRPLHFGQLHHSEIGSDIQTEEPQTKCAQKARATQSNTQSHSPPHTHSQSQLHYSPQPPRTTHSSPQHPSSRPPQDDIALPPILQTIRSAHIISFNAGPIGLMDSLPCLSPILALRPVAVLVQEAHIPHARLQALRRELHRNFPAYSLFVNRRIQLTGERIDVLTLVHIKMSARASLLDIRPQFCTVHEQIPDALAKIHFVRLLDPAGQVSILLGNVHNYQAGQHMQQAAMLTLINRVVDRWGSHSHHIIIGGDWNSSLKARKGYATDSVTVAADERLAAWSLENDWCYAAPSDFTWTDGRHQATLDAFFTRNKQSATEPHIIESVDPRHDHRGLRIFLPDENIGPMPELESLRKPIRLKLKGLREANCYKKFTEQARTEIANISQSVQEEGCTFKRLALLKTAVLRGAKIALGISGGRIRSLIQRHSETFIKLAARVRLLRVVRAELLSRKASACVTPPSKAMKKLWHECQEVYPEGTTFQALGALANDRNWSRSAVGGLRAHLHKAGEELHQLRRAELKGDLERHRQVEIESFWSGGGLHRFLHPPSPALHSQVLRADLVESITVEGTEQAMDSLVRGGSFNAACDRPKSISAKLTSTEQLATILTAIEQVEARVTAFERKAVFTADRVERLAQWERTLGSAAGATHQRCPKCKSKSLTFVPGLLKNGNWWCCGCSRFSTPVVEKSEYSGIPVDTAKIPRIPAGATLRGPVARNDLDWYLATLSNGLAPGPDEVPYELLKFAPEELKHSLHECINAILVDGLAPPADWLGGLVRFLPKPGGDPLEPTSYRPVCLLVTVYKILSAIINDRLYRLCERHGLLESSQEGFRRMRSTQRQIQSLSWVIEEAAQAGAPLYVAYLDFENAFNSVDHEAVWHWLTELNVPDVDLLRSLYEGAHYEADLPYGKSAPVYLTRGTKQGDILSPLLFGLLFNALLTGLRQSGVGHNTICCKRTNSRGFADDLVLSTATAGGMQRLLQVVSDFCNWSGMRLQLKKSVITAFDFGRRCSLPTEGIHYNGSALVNLPPEKSFRYLGVRMALTKNRKKKGTTGPCTEDEVSHVLHSTKDLTRLLMDHQMPLSIMVPSMRMVAAARFRYSAALVPWTDADLDRLFKVWMQVERAAWKLQCSFPSAQFRLPPEAGGMQLEHPKVVLIQALSTHVRQLVALPDCVRDSTIRSYRQLCTSCGCLNERELAQYLAAERKPRSSPVARLLRACGQLQIHIKLPDCITAGKIAREGSWFSFRNHLASRVAADDESGQRDLACVSKHWTTIRKRLRSRGIHFPRQLILDPRAQEPLWLLPEQMKGNPGWLKPLKRLVRRADARTMFPILDRAVGAPDQQAHQALISELLASGQADDNMQRRPPSAIFSDPGWARVRSSAPMDCWVRFLERAEIRLPARKGKERARAIVEMLTAIGSQEAGHSERLRKICLWIAPSLYSVGKESDRNLVSEIFAEHAVLSREYVSFQAKTTESEEEVERQVGTSTVRIVEGVVKIEGGDNQHIGTVNLGRWRLLKNVYDEEELIRALPSWIAQVEREERTRGVPSHQLWRGICRAFQADLIWGCNPLVAPSCFSVSFLGMSEEGWGHGNQRNRRVFNLLCMPAQEMVATVTSLRRDDAWLALTRRRTLVPEAEKRLQMVGTRIQVWPRGTKAAAGTGIWRKGQVRSISTNEDWILWASAQTSETVGFQLQQELKALILTRDGAVPLDADCPSFKEALLGPGGASLNYSGTIIATDGAVKSDGSMGAAYVALGNRIPPRSFVVLGPPSAMRSELSGLDQALADAPAETDLTLLTDSLSSITKLMSMQRQDFPEWLHGHPEKVLLESITHRINARARAKVMTRLIKVPAHKAHPLNEAADAAASAAAEAASSEWIPLLSHVDSNAVRFYLNGRLTEWGAGVRKHLIYIMGQQHAEQLRRVMTQQAADMRSEVRSCGRKERVSLADRWLLRSSQGRWFLGTAMAGMRNGAQKRRIMQTVAGMFPCRAILYKWNKAPSPKCLLCNGENETIAHIQCWCPALKDARILAHHAIANVIFQLLRTLAVGNWVLLSETPVHALRAIDVPQDLYDPWNRMVDVLEEAVSDEERTDEDRPQRLSRLRPDGWAISWSRRQVLLLELTRAHDWQSDWYMVTDRSKKQRYRGLQERMSRLLPQGWTVVTLPLTLGVRGSFDELSWKQVLDRFGITEDKDQRRFMSVVTRQVLEELDRMYGVRSEALRRMQDAQQGAAI